MFEIALVKICWQYEFKVAMYSLHSKLRPIYPPPKIQKNYPRQDIKTGKSPRSGKVRKGQKSGCFPRSNRENGQKPNWTKLTKIDLKGSHLLALK